MLGALLKLARVVSCNYKSTCSCLFDELIFTAKTKNFMVFCKCPAVKFRVRTLVLP